MNASDEETDDEATRMRGENERLRRALHQVIAHTGHLPNASTELLVGLLASCARIARSALAGAKEGT